jgi:hypothetical protein
MSDNDIVAIFITACDSNNTSLAMSLWARYCGRSQLVFRMMSHVKQHYSILCMLCEYDQQHNAEFALTHLVVYRESTLLKRLCNQLNIRWHNSEDLWYCVQDPDVMRIFIDADTKKVGLCHMQYKHMEALLSAGMPLSWFVQNAAYLSSYITSTIPLYRNIFNMMRALVDDITQLPPDLCNIIKEYIN